MKQMWKVCFVIALVVSVGLMGYALTAGDKDQTLTEPPRLVVRCGTQSVKAGNGPHEWQSAIVAEKINFASKVDRGDNERDYDKSILRPLRLSEQEEKNEPLTARLEFDSAQPDEVTIRYWQQDEYWECEDVDGAAAPIPVRVTEKNGADVPVYEFSLAESSGLYEITAKWTRKENYSGTAAYAFYTE